MIQAGRLMLVLGLLFASAAAAPAQDKAWQDCRAEEPDRVIAGCAEVLGRGVKESASNRATAHFNRGFAYRQKDDLDQAIRDYSEAIRLNPKFALAYNNRGWAYDKKAEYGRAIKDYDDAIRLDPKLALAYVNRGWTYAKKGEYDSAIANYSEVIRLDPKLVAAYTNRGLVYDKKAEYDSAIADYSAAIRLDPKLALAYGSRGVAYEKKGDLLRALADYEKAADLDPQASWTNKALTRARTVLAARSNSPSPGAETEPAPNPAAAASSAPRPYDPGVRVALVIGNSSYHSVTRLPNPSRDATTIAQALREAGFRTVQVEADLSREGMVKALRRFQAEADRADWAVIYYAGHGIEMNGQNYLVPVDASLRSDRDVADEAVPLERVLAAVEGTRKLRLVILDACRDNPFLSTMSRTVASRSIGQGLARVEPEGGTLVAYAAKAGQVAADGTGQNSPFVSALAKHMSRPGVDINRVFRGVRDDVLAATGRKQEPFIYGSLPDEDFFFRVQ